MKIIHELQKLLADKAVITCKRSIGFAFINEKERQEILTEIRKTNTVYDFYHPIVAKSVVLVELTVNSTSSREEVLERSKLLQENFAQWREKNPHATIIYFMNTFSTPQETDHSTLWSDFGIYGGMITYVALHYIYTVFQDKIGIADHPSVAHSTTFTEILYQLTQDASFFDPIQERNSS